MRSACGRGRDLRRTLFSIFGRHRLYPTSSEKSEPEDDIIDLISPVHVRTRTLETVPWDPTHLGTG